MKKLSILILIIIFASSWFYWFQWRPEKKLNECLKTVRDEYHATWNNYCIRLGKERDCRWLPSDTADYINKQRTEKQNRCVRIWK